MWVTELDQPLKKYTIVEERGQKMTIQEEFILKKTGHCRLTMEFLKVDKEPAYEIAYSGNFLEIKKKYIFLCI